MKAIRIFLLVLIVIGFILLLTQKFWVPKLVDQILLLEATQTNKETPSKKTGETVSKISISDQKIKEANFSGTMPVISGTGLLASKMRAYIEEKVSEFRKQANADVPDLRKNFGADNPTADYEIDINAKYLKSGKTDSIVTDVYTFTGGAHGSTIYKVLTASLSDGKILSLANIIKKGSQDAFTEFVKKQLNDWKPDGSTSSVVFPDMVKDLKFNSFTNWSLDDKNLNIYFDQYAIGPGVLGATAFPLFLEQIKNFLQ